MKLYAVITGDIINFTQLSPQNRYALIEEYESLLKSWIKKSSDAEIYRGDSYQIIFEDIQEALTKSIQLLCWFKLHSDHTQQINLGTRISIGIGEVSYRGKNVLSSDGEAFHLSGRNFDQLRNGEYLAIKTNNEEKNKAIDVILNFINRIIKEWTLAQAEVIFLLLENKTQQQIADILSLSQPSINSRLKLANWKDIELAIKYISDLVQKK
ncbi:hypothetical protein [Pedobacter sp.]|uniref:hypothetical protein n=1 Tax=Pedobacter sp. TaxID=1411316 RepID=UPI003D7F8AC8